MKGIKMITTSGFAWNNHPHLVDAFLVEFVA